MDAFFGEIRAFPFSFAPLGWELCDGSLLQVQYNQALYAVIGNTYGGTTGKTFALPKLGGLSLAGVGTVTGGTIDYKEATNVGTETVNLTLSTFPYHTHGFNGATGAPAARVGTATNATYLTNFQTPGNPPIAASGYEPGSSANTVLASQSISTVGAGASHPNQSPYLVMGFYICNDGLFPIKG